MFINNTYILKQQQQQQQQQHLTAQTNIKERAKKQANTRPSLETRIYDCFNSNTRHIKKVKLTLRL